MQAKFPSESLTTLTDVVLPGETNPLNNLFGGELLVNGINIGGIPMIQITLTNVPQESCGKMAANYVIASKSRVQINGIDDFELNEKDTKELHRNITIKKNSVMKC